MLYLLQVIQKNVNAMQNKEYTLDRSELYEQTMVIFIESEPNSNKYRQLILSPKQFKDILDAVAKVFGEKKHDERLMVAEYLESTEEYILADDLRSSYIEDELEIK